MQTVSVTWEHSLETAAVLVAVGGAMALSKDKRVALSARSLVRPR